MLGNICGFVFLFGISIGTALVVYALVRNSLCGVLEVLYRGYAIERLASVTGNYWWSGLIATTVFALVHLPMWGWGPVATFFVSGGLLALFFIWTQDLLACMIAHVITDAVGFITAQRAS